MAVALVKKNGDKVAAEQLGVARATLSRLLAGLPLSRGTLALVREAFARGAAS